VVLLGAGSTVACFGGGSDEFDSASGCCVSYCNACEPDYHECDDDDPHADAVCHNPYDDTGDSEDDTGTSQR
jgi:hypothetical protein